MRHLYRHAVIILVIIILCVWAIYPPDKQLKLAKDLGGGSTLVYQVDVRPTDPPDTLSRVSELIKDRLDPRGVADISVVSQGSSRLEISMPLPGAAVRALREEFQKELARLGDRALTSDELDRRLALAPVERDAEIVRLAGGEPARAEAFTRLAKAYDNMQAARALARPQIEALQADRASQSNQLAAATDASMKKLLQDKIKALDDAIGTAAQPAAEADIAFEAAKQTALASSLTGAEMRRVLELDPVDHRFPGVSGPAKVIPSPRSRAITRLKDEHPSAKAEIERIVQKWEAYQKERRTLDDTADVKRLLRGAGVLEFRITVSTGELASERDLRDQLHKGGPRSITTGEAKWYKINKLDSWFRDPGDFDRYQNGGAAAFFGVMGYIVEEYDGEPYMLCYDTAGLRLTQAEGAWQVASSRRTADQLGRPAIGFEMDVLGAQKMGELTGANVRRRMAVLLDDQVYTAPNLNSRIGGQGIIEGEFSAPEIDYIVRVLGSGSMAAKLSPDPVSESTIGPGLGADNLKRGLEAGAVAMVVVAGFMIVYYFGSGAIAVAALLFNFILVLAVMAAAKTAFSLPGIAGVILTFGQAVDANVLIYERMREEMQRGHDLRTAVRLGFSRALSPIVDGNISNLIICAVLGFFGTQEIRGFAVTLGIGIVTTLFSTLYMTRFLFTFFIEKLHWRHASQLPMAVPFIQSLLHPHVNWMKHRWFHLGLLVVFLAAMAVITWNRGSDLLGTEFRGGTAVTLTFKATPGTDGKPVHTKLTRSDVEKRVKDIAATAPADSPLRQLADAQIIAVNPDADNVTSDTFTIKSRLTSPNIVQNSLAVAFNDVLESRPPLHFTASETAGSATVPAFPIVDPILGDTIKEPKVVTHTGDFYGGTAVVLESLTPAPTLSDLEDRIRRARDKAGLTDTNSRVVIIEGTEDAVRSAAVMSKDPLVSYLDSPKIWESTIRDREWNLVRGALTETQTLASVQSFSPAIAQTFAIQGVWCTVLSLLLLTFYVFIRFGTLRWAMAATIPLFADVIGIVGLLAVAQMLYANPSTHGFAHSIGLLPFELDLAQIAAVLTIVGYSLNDKIIILDRIRENKGRSPYASAQVINDSINQTLSRTVITAGAHMITTIVLYVYGGEAVRGFAYTFNLGVLLGTYTSIVSTPLVWSRKAEPNAAPTGKPAEYAPAPTV